MTAHDEAPRNPQPPSSPDSQGQGPSKSRSARPSFVSALLRWYGLHRPSRRVIVVLLLATAVACGFELLSVDRLIAFRDAGHYYEPLLRWQAESMQRGDGVLWDPHESLGRSLIADPTAATFYPPAIALRLVPAPWPLKLNAFLWGHLLLAGFGAAWGARLLGAGRPGALLSGIAYLACGALLTQVSNCVFLVSAAWLPWGLAAGWQAMRLGSLPLASLAALAIGAMVLGGDPQTAVHAILALVLALPWQIRRAAPASRPASGPLSLPIHLLNFVAARRQALFCLTLISIAAALVSAVQVVPSLEAAKQSDRRIRREPRSLYEGLQDLTREDLRTPAARVEHVSRGWFGEPLLGTHHDASLQFSLPPWQWGELLWPNFSGRGQPNHRRWIDGIPAADRSWYPSIYLGGVSLLLALASLAIAVRNARRRQTVRWLQAGVIVFLILSLGWYGPGWLLRELQQSLGERFPSQWLNPASWNPALGGLYWCAQWLIPGYADFRFPAKAFVVASLFIAWLAGMVIGHFQAKDARTLSRLAALLAAFSCTALVIAWWQESNFRTWASTLPADGTFGPLDLEGAWGDLQQGVAHGLILFTIAWGVFSALDGLARRSETQPNAERVSTTQRKRWSATTRWQLAVSLGLASLLDLSIAQRGLLINAPADLWQKPSPLQSAIVNTANEPDSAASDSSSDAALSMVSATVPPLRVYRAHWDGWTPKLWWSTSSSQRLSHVIAWDRASWFPKHHRFDRVHLVEAPGSSQDAVHWMLMRVARHHGWTRSDGALEPHPAILTALGAEWLVVPTWDQDYWLSAQPDLNVIERQVDWPESVALLHNPAALPEAWIVDQVQAHPSPERMTALDDLWRWIETGLTDEQAGVEQWQRVALIDAAPAELEALHAQSVEPQSTSIESSTANDNAGDTLIADPRWIYRTHQRLELQVEVAQPSWLVVAHAYDPAWRVWVLNRADQWEERRMLRANFVMRGVPLQPGDTVVKFEYLAAPSPWPGIVSLASAAALIALLIPIRSKRLR